MSFIFINVDIPSREIFLNNEHCVVEGRIDVGEAGNRITVGDFLSYIFVNGLWHPGGLKKKKS